MIFCLYVRLLTTAFAAMNFKRILYVCKSDQSVLNLGALYDLLVGAQVFDLAQTLETVILFFDQIDKEIFTCRVSLRGSAILEVSLHCQFLLIC